MKILSVLFFVFLFSSTALAETIEGWENEPWKPRLFEMKPDQAEVSLDGQQAVDGKRCLKVGFIFDNKGNDGTVVLAEALVLTREFEPALDLNGMKALSVCVKRNKGFWDGQLNLWVTDLDGDTYVFKVPVGLTPGEWRRVVIPLDPAAASLRRWGNGRWDGWGRVRSLSFEVTDAANPKIKSGPDGETLYLDELTGISK